MKPAKIKIPEIKQLIIYFAKNTYKAKEADSMSQDIMQKCLSLIDVDYKYSIIYNTTGDICEHYPSHLIILEKEKIHKYKDPNISDVSLSPSCTEEDIVNKYVKINKLKNLIKKARFARCRFRFPLPVIVYKGRYICRSATLSGGIELYSRAGLNYMSANSESNSETEQEVDKTKQELDETKQKVAETKQKVDETVSSTVREWKLFHEVRHKDIRLLNTFNVGIIIDFMVENKKVKYGVKVSSSEKIDKYRRYSNFSIISLPYPGCEFFKGFRENDYVADNLMFDWSQAYIDAKINVPEDTISSQLQIDWNHYQQWDILVLTQNYLKLILRYLSESSNGMLIHCISGWDRTPLFISLLRLSLWADKVIHTSLDAHQMLYFTIAYDWMLFGHDLEDRLSKGEEIFFFCFYFLKYICDEDFSIKQNCNERDSKSSSSNDDEETRHHIFDMELETEEPSVSSSGSNRNCEASRDDEDSEYNRYTPPEILGLDSPPKTEEFGDSIKHDSKSNSSDSDLQIVEPTFVTKLETKGSSISVSSSDSNRNCGASRDDEDSEYKRYTPPEIFGFDSPPKTEEFSDSIKHDSKSNSSDSGLQIMEPAFVMKLETKGPSISVSSSDSNRNCGASRDDEDSEYKRYTPPEILGFDSPPKTEEFGDRKTPSLVPSLNKEETAHESSVPHGQTSPVVVPGRRQETESTTPVGSWQIITETGSFEGATTVNEPLVKQSTPSSINSFCESMTDSIRTVIERKTLSSESRKDRLCFLRNAFYTAYNQTGFRMKENSEPSNLSQILESISGIFSQNTSL
ncbi:Myotubularin-related protein 14 [Melipona quadrifasciata]|uniref:Myotubularin-related protein 14 n=1 Tax=Melipona quadrifasciata TaxID=166423 RepID=A0A0N0BCX8_9HYME|nr:Myotubularin-related protein 14 [Melipona quadrifasciata]